MNWRQLRDRSIKMAALSASGTPPNISYGEGFIVHDAYESIIFDDLRRKFPVWDMITKHPTNSDFTTGFLQSAIGAARMVDKNTLTFSATSDTRSAHTPQEVKACTTDRNYGMYKRSLYAQQGSQYGDLTAKGVRDMYVAIMKVWNDKLYNGTVSGDPLDFEGLKILIGAGSTVLATSSVIKAIQQKVVDMMNTTTKDVMPTAVYANPQVRYYITQEQMKMKLQQDGVGSPSGKVTQGVPIGFIDTQAGVLPVVGDPFNTVVAGTPNTYPTFIVSDDKLRWEYVEPLGQAGAEPKIFEFPQTTILDTPYKGIMFGALDGDGFSDHFARLNVEARTTIVDPTA